MKAVLIFFLIVSVIYIIKELYSFIQHIIYVQRFSEQQPVGKSLKYEISIIRQFGILFTISYIITYIIV
jgi:hypothetical protein